MKTVGILGGMGSMATVDLFSKIVSNTQANCDQDHLHIIVDNYAAIPDRSHYILYKDKSPLPMMIEAAKRLELAGAELIAMPCNTAHYFFDRIQEAIKVPMVHMMEETSKTLTDKAVLLATKGTYQADLYKDMYYPNDQMKEDLSELIYTYKSHQRIDHLLKEKILNQLESVEKIVLGCTELPLIFHEDHARYVDPTEILARAVIIKAGGKVKKKSQARA